MNFAASRSILTLALGLAAMAASAQAPVPGESGGSTSSSANPSFGRSWASADGFSLVPFTRRGYVGVNLGLSLIHI